MLSIYLDGKPLPSVQPQVEDFSKIPFCLEIDDEYSLVDLPYCRRKISGMKLLSYLKEDSLISLPDKLNDCKEIIIIMDYYSDSVIAKKLFLKRVLQAVDQISQIHSELIFILAGDETIWKKMIRKMYVMSE